MFGIVALAHGLDEVFAPVLHFQVFQSITIFAYCAGEFRSLTETLERGGLGVVVLPVLRGIVKTVYERLEEKGEKELEAKGVLDKEDEQ